MPLLYGVCLRAPRGAAAQLLSTPAVVPVAAPQPAVVPPKLSGADAVALLSASTGNPVTLTTTTAGQQVQVVCTATDGGSPAQTAVAAVATVAAVAAVAAPRVLLCLR